MSLFLSTNNKRKVLMILGFKSWLNAAKGTILAFALLVLVSCGVSTMTAQDTAERTVEASQIEFERDFDKRVSQTLREQRERNAAEIRDIHDKLDKTYMLLSGVLESSGYVVLPNGKVLPPAHKPQTITNNTTTNTDNSQRTTFSQNINTRITKEESK
ncbi:hypothetical protein [Pseudomonas sp. LFM046]|uniref:hypothetical protein n=1 Tax=Pseudomonas sp. LFM046 TaxID=1608357 RepID=UPI000B098F36|nr:hypothetical protein [Pseudomonas sp. LFM046]